MRRIIFAGCLIVTAGPALADVTAICKLDKGTVTVAFTNPESKTMQCEVNCNMAIANGLGTVVCVKPVPGGAKDLVLCTEKGDGPPYTRVKDQEVNCRDPEGTPVSPEEQKAKEKADDEESDALIKKMQQDSIEMLKQMQKMKQQ
ncbi:MAG: hypothetical protein NTZ72_09120 [Afipia sp.]|nr:hypothetical protein [Afipia sp.]